MSAHVDLGRSLAQDPAGIWRPRATQSRQLSFPSEGHDVCFGIEDDSFWYAHRNDCITAALQRARVEGPLLDIGGGNGAVSLALERSHIDTVLLEPGDSGAQNARRRGLRHVVCATLEDAGFAPASFGAAGLFDVIEHVEDDQELLRQAHDILRPQGTLCVTVPALRWLWSAEDEVAGHFRRYTLGSLRESLERAGFAVLYETYMFAALTAPVFLFRAVRHRLSKRSASTVDQGAAAQHTPSPVMRRAMKALLAPELARIRAGRGVPFGTSCLAVAVRT